MTHLSSFSPTGCTERPARVSKVSHHPSSHLVAPFRPLPLVSGSIAQLLLPCANLAALTEEDDNRRAPLPERWVRVKDLCPSSPGTSASPQVTTVSSLVLRCPRRPRPAWRCASPGRRPCVFPAMRAGTPRGRTGVSGRCEDRYQGKGPTRWIRLLPGQLVVQQLRPCRHATLHGAPATGGHLGSRGWASTRTRSSCPSSRLPRPGQLPRLRTSSGASVGWMQLGSEVGIPSELPRPHGQTSTSLRSCGCRGARRSPPKRPPGP